jgi:hypothetical protein
MPADVATALRLGWAMAEVRGRLWPDGPRPVFTPLPEVPHDELLPLRSQRDSQDSLEEAVAGLVRLATEIRPGRVDEFTRDLPTIAARGDSDRDGWHGTATFFRAWDGQLQDHLAIEGEPLANAYLLGRGLAECYWGLGRRSAWDVDGMPTGVSPQFLFGEDRQRELTRMLGRLDPGDVHELTPSAVAGTLEAWEEVARHQDWIQHPKLEVLVYEQVRRWYQLVIVRRDPTTLVRPGARLPSLAVGWRNLRAFWPQAALGLVGIASATAFVPTIDDGKQLLSSALATGGLGALAAATLLGKGQSAAQRIVMRLRQDAYTDLVVQGLASVPDAPSWRHRLALERAVRTRRLTPPTPPPYTSV